MSKLVRDYREINPMAIILKAARKLFWLNLMAAIPVYIYFMYEFKQAGMW
jgi:hypothetical protein